jgi:glycosyltransferase involved in cell wall biosynthesis
MINILFIHQSAELYGSDKTLLILLAKLDKAKFRGVVILPFDGPLKTALEKEEIKVVVAPVLKLYRKMFTPKNIFLFLKDVKKGISILEELHTEYKFDLVYSNTLAVLLGLIYAKKRKIKHIWHVHEIIVHPKTTAFIFPKILNKYAYIVVCNSKATKKNLVDREQRLQSKAIIIYNGIEEGNRELTSSIKEDFGFTQTDIIITLVGRISRLKGHKLLLNVVINHLKEENKVKLLFVGSPVEGQEYYLREIEKIIFDNIIQEKIKIIPFTVNLNPIWNITDIAVMPSTEAESFGLVAIEAMLAKKPVIGSNHGGLTEILIDNETGFLVKPNNEKALFEALLKLIENPELRNSFGEKGYQRAIKEFSADKYVQSFENLFNDILND